MKKVLFLLVLLVAGMFLVSCEDTATDQVYKYNGCEITFVENVDFSEQQAVRSLLNKKNLEATLTLKADGSYELKNGEEVENGTYKLENGKITLTSGNKTQSGVVEGTSLKFTISGNEYISEKISKVTFIYSK